MRGLPSSLSLFRNGFNKFNNTRAQMLDSIYNMTNTLKSDFWRKNVIILSLCTQCQGSYASGKLKKFQGQVIVREFFVVSGKNECFLKCQGNVREF